MNVHWLKKLHEKTRYNLLKIDSEIELLKAKRKRYIEMLADNVITHEEYREAADNTYELIAKLKTKRSELQASLQDDNQTEKEQQLKNTIALFLGIKDVTEEIIHHLISRIEVNAKGVPNIICRFFVLPN